MWLLSREIIRIWPRKDRSSSSGGGRTPWRGRLERLEERVVLATAGNLTMAGATALSPQVVSAQYQVTGQGLTGTMPLDIYRSPTAAVGSSSILVGRTTLQATDLAVGSHQVTVNLSQILDINPSMKYVLAVADPSNTVAETTKTDNAASFRTWIVGAVTHGLELDGQFPSWVTMTTSGLTADGYDAVVPFDWARLSASPTPGSVPLAAQGMTAQINQAIASLPLQPGDVVDVHLIGHSRGGDVVSLVAGELNRSALPLSGGYLKLTLLDPHPARNGPVAYNSFSNGPIGRLAQMQYLAFQSSTNDPPLTIPPGVNSTEVFYQQTKVPNALLPAEHFLNSWGEVPAGGATAGVTYYNMTSSVNSHEGIHDFYYQQIVPLLATGLPIPIAPSPVPTAPKDGGPALPNARAGSMYEDGLLRTGGVQAPVASHLLRSYGTLDGLLAAHRYQAVGPQVTKMERFLTRQSGRGIPAAATPYFLGQLQLVGPLLIPAHPSARAAPAMAHLGRVARHSSSR